MSTHTELLERVEAFIKAADMSATRFGQEAAADPNFVHQLRDGREPRTKVRERVLAFMEKAEKATRRKEKAA